MQAPVRSEQRPGPLHLEDAPQLPCCSPAGGSGNTHRGRRAAGGEQVTATVLFIQLLPEAVSLHGAVPSGRLCPLSGGPGGRRARCFLLQHSSESSCFFSFSGKCIPQLNLPLSADSGPELLP